MWDLVGISGLTQGQAVGNDVIEPDLAVRNQLNQGVDVVLHRRLAATHHDEIRLLSWRNPPWGLEWRPCFID